MSSIQHEDADRSESVTSLSTATQSSCRSQGSGDDDDTQSLLGADARRSDGSRPRVRRATNKGIRLGEQASRSVESVSVTGLDTPNLASAKSYRVVNATATERRPTNGPTPVSRFLGTSQDVLLAASHNASSSSMATSSRNSIPGVSLLGSGASTPATTSGKSNRAPVVPFELYNDSTTTKQQQQRAKRLQGLADEGALGIAEDGSASARPVDENTLKGFSAFIYNRLAQGHTSNFTQNDGTYNLSYFIWFKQTSVRSLTPAPPPPPPPHLDST